MILCSWSRSQLCFKIALQDKYLSIYKPVLFLKFIFIYVCVCVCRSVCLCVPVCVIRVWVSVYVGLCVCVSVCVVHVWLLSEVRRERWIHCNWSYRRL